MKILSVSPFPSDHEAVEAGVPPGHYQVLQAGDLTAALSMMQDVCIVVCEQNLIGASWIDMLHRLRQRLNPPLLIVTSHLADERLWAEALNLGAWDVLAKPLVKAEVNRSIEQALRHCCCRTHAVTAQAS